MSINIIIIKFIIIFQIHTFTCKVLKEMVIQYLVGIALVILSLKTSICLSCAPQWCFMLSSSYSTAAEECWSKRWRWGGKCETATCPLCNREQASLSEPCRRSRLPGGKVWGWWALAGFSPAVGSWTGFPSETTGPAQERDQNHSLDVEDQYKLHHIITMMLHNSISLLELLLLELLHIDTQKGEDITHWSTHFIRYNRTP